MNLAINGARPIRSKLFPKQETVGMEEQDAVREFMCGSPILSGYRGSYGPNFWGGNEVQKFEKKLIDVAIVDEDYQALAVNSCTSALIIACGAIGLGPGDEVIVTPWSMSCSATAPMFWGASPVFADIEKDCFCLDPESVKDKITERTKAIIVVDLFGQPYNYKEINKIAKENNLYVIEDAAQAIGSYTDEFDEDDYAGSFGDIGCFSFTQGKHLTAGEGGAIVTKNKELYYKCALLRNHAEAVVNGMTEKNIEKYEKMIGMNLRMTEIQAVILQIQLDKLNKFIELRNDNVEELDALINIPGIVTAKTRENCKNSYYVMAMHYDEGKIGVHRDKFVSAVKAELTEETGRIDRGVPINAGYIKPLYEFPIFKDNPIISLPIVRKLQNRELIITLYQNLNLNDNDSQDIADAFEKVYKYRDEL